MGDLANYVYSHFIGYPVILGVKILLGRSFPASQGLVAKMLSYGILPGTGSIVMIVILLRILGVAISGPVLATLTILVVLVSIYLLG
jgi:amino acid transporter